MILTTNRLKNKRVKLDDDDEFNYMNFLRFKHLMDRRDRLRNTNNKSTQTEIETNNDKATNTVDELLEPFRLKMRSENNENNQKATQTTALRDQETGSRFRIYDDAYTLKGSERSLKSKSQQRRDMMVQVYMAPLNDTPPDTDDDDEPSNALKALGITTKLALKGGALGLGLSMGITNMLLSGAINLYDAMQTQQQEEEQEDEEGNQTEVIEVESSPPISVNSSGQSPDNERSSSSSAITVDSSSLPTPTELAMPTSPVSSRRNSRSSNESRKST